MCMYVFVFVYESDYVVILLCGIIGVWLGYWSSVCFGAILFELLKTACSSHLLSRASGCVGNFCTNSL